jgi:hypothetical protein
MARQVKRQTENWTYVLEADRALPEDQQTRFTLKPLGPQARAQVLDALSTRTIFADGTNEVRSHRHRQSLNIVVNGIVSVENFPVGAPHAWPDELDARVRYVDQLDDNQIAEIADEIWRVSTPVPQKSAPEFQEV